MAPFSANGIFTWSMALFFTNGVTNLLAAIYFVNGIVTWATAPPSFGQRHHYFAYSFFYKTSKSHCVQRGPWELKPNGTWSIFEPIILLKGNK
ncbi:hypothetical protein BDB00DRAFT_168785 [Zychaea mexicana]|uniref:uncharacterized protein n=1 Tax=Zychaea mexicana TaxID=64656 RepID=UPI0022FDB777|nr:uncharacterized protein BDB00DRAFT_168785 [Zychaea mexicana]KAI9482566.1 hypothetical protein BDB00DRAFT_168785 [Zychaea mexicana]